MKRVILLLFALVMCMVLSKTFTVKLHAEGDVAINDTNFPDTHFRDYVFEKFDRDEDGYLDAEEIAAVTYISVTNNKCTSLKGVEYFTNLTRLECGGNRLTSLDVSQNTALEILYCHGNQLTSLDVSQNTALEKLFCYGNKLTNLNMSNNLALTYLSCSDNQLTKLVVSNNTALTYLFCDNNRLSSLNVSKNTALKEFYCKNNQLTSLDVSKNTALTRFDCSNNQLMSLNLSNTANMTFMYCQNNQLEKLDVSNSVKLRHLDCRENQLTSLDVSKNTALYWLYCEDNQLGELDLGDVTLHELDCRNNRLTSLNINNGIYLRSLSCNGNDISSLDVSSCDLILEILRDECRYEDGDIYFFEANVNTGSDNVDVYLSLGKKTEIVVPETVITKQPKTTVVVEIGSKAQFTVAATGAGLKYQWQYSSNRGSTWKDTTGTGYNTTTLTTSDATAARNGYRYRCVITNYYGVKTISSFGELHIKTVITSQPVNVYAAVGETVKFTVGAVGAGLKYQWQYLSLGNNWRNCTGTGCNTDTLSVKVTEENGGYLYHCVIMNANNSKKISDYAIVIVNTTITSQPKSVSATVGTPVEFTVTATGSSLSYQWQVSTDGSTWKNSNASGADTNSISLKATESKNGYRYRCIVTDVRDRETVSSAGKLTIKTAITTPPKSVSVTRGTTVKFTVGATGAGLKYRWQVSTDGSTWKNSNATGYNTKTISLKATTSKNGYRYRCVITDANGSKVTSSAARLTVK